MFGIECSFDVRVRRTGPVGGDRCATTMAAAAAAAAGGGPQPRRWRLALAFALAVAFAAPAARGWTPRNGSRIQINSRPADASRPALGPGVRGQSSIRLGTLKNRLKEPVELSTTPMTTTTSTERFRRQQPAPASSVNRQGHQTLTVGLVLPYKSFDTRVYTKEFTSAIHGLQRIFKSRKDNIFKSYDIHHIIDMKQLTPTPTGQCPERASDCTVPPSKRVFVFTTVRLPKRSVRIRGLYIETMLISCTRLFKHLV